MDTCIILEERDSTILHCRYELFDLNLKVIGWLLMTHGAVSSCGTTGRMSSLKTTGSQSHRLYETCSGVHVATISSSVETRAIFRLYRERIVKDYTLHKLCLHTSIPPRSSSCAVRGMITIHRSLSVRLKEKFLRLIPTKKVNSFSRLLTEKA